MGIILVLVFGSPFQRKTFSRIGVGIKTFVSRTTFCIVFKFVLAMKKLNKLPLGVKQQWMNQSINRMPCLITNVNLSFCPLSFVYYVLCPLTLDFFGIFKCFLYILVCFVSGIPKMFFSYLVWLVERSFAHSNKIRLLWELLPLRRANRCPF